MSLDQRIKAWLQEITPTCESTTTHQSNDIQPCRKRRRLNPLTPETSPSCDSSRHSMASGRGHGSPGKRSHPDNHYHHGDASEETPRASSRKVKAPRSESSYSLPSAQSHYEASERSGYSSPTKQLFALERDAKGVVPRELSAFHNQPPSLEDLLDKIDLVSTGFGILPTSQRELLNHLDEDTYSEFKWTRRRGVSDIYFSDQRADLGCTPPPNIIHGILHQAAFCNSRSSPEAEWNAEVHQRVLEAALRPSGGPGVDQLVDFRLSTTAALIKEYHAPVSATKKVDFCIYLDPSCDQQHADVPHVIDALRDVLPLGAFNHTNLNSLSDRPIAVSIETKKTGEGWENARLQMQVWSAAHWQFLRKLLELRQRVSEEISRIGQQAIGAAATDPEPTPVVGYKLPDFLPGIIIQGHDWHLVITTREGDKIIFWQKKTFGNTSSSKGIYQIICTLQLLRRWAQVEYWVWLQKLLGEWPRCNGQPLVL
ncbi:hypothetical protein CDV36_010315 [Fusarium kuroshium]|uniref:PD-(D/E)XK nuclease-like domain-containing protein n=1 Tax=Fusarium kuroshium TaxID=2010991 RepID=A0A3M2RXR5_9HYPO|nr:hypothetical protein CDV36_010315 [Fusarium kuroshium]